MLKLRVKVGEWVDIAHRSGEPIRVKIEEIVGPHARSVEFVFDDDARNFEISKESRQNRKAEAEGRAR